MAQPTDTLDRYDLATRGDNVREQLADRIYDVSPTQTPFMTTVGRGANSNDYFTWQQDQLATPDGSNAAVDGDDFTANALQGAARIGNYNQISRKGVVVSERADKVNKAGRARELARQTMRKARELKRDQETILMSNQAGLAGNSTTAPLTAGLVTWYKTNEARAAGGASAPLSNTTYGFPNAVATDAGTTRALSETLMLDVCQSAYINGGDPTHCFVSPTVKRRISNYLFTTNARIATQYQDQGKGLEAAKVVGAVDWWLTDFGPIQIIPDRWQRDRDVHIIDPEYWSIDYLRSYHLQKMGKTGDNNKRLLVVDYGLCSKNEESSGTVADVDHTAAMVA